MKTTTTICNRCLLPIESEEDRESLFRHGGERVRPDIPQEFDFHSSCADVILAALMELLGKPVTRDPVEEVEKVC